MGPAEISAQLGRVLSSPQFSQAARLSRFLRFVVEAAQAGQTVKEYPIGVEVFDRGKDFDPRIDPIVRVQAAKLRSKLMEYYGSAGAQDTIVIGLPKGSYVPEIREKPSSPVMAPQAPLDRSRIAVLPFVNMSPDPENEYFSDGLTEELINRLTSVPSLQVVARTSVFRFKGRYEDVREVGAKLNVGAVLEGSVRKADGRLRITAQLIDVRSGYHLFSKTYQREYKDVFELQDELAQEVVDEIEPLSSGVPSKRIAKTREVNLDAYNLYLRGMFALSNRFADSGKWIQLFREAIEIEPGYAPAWAGLAHGYFMGAWFYQTPDRDAMPLSREAALRTLELDGNSPQGHCSLGLVSSVYEWNWTAAETSFRRAIELQPGLAATYPFFAWCCLLPQSRMDEAGDMARRGLALDPFNPLYHAVAITIYVLAGRYDEAHRQSALAMAVSPDFPPIVAAGAAAHEFSGHPDKAIPIYRKLCETTNYVPGLASQLAHALAISGEKGEARRILDRLLALPDAPAIDIATVYSGLRDANETTRWLEAAAEERQVHLIFVPPDPRFAWLRSNPRFQDFLKRMGITNLNYDSSQTSA
jgi:adenylate cyclase